MSGDGNLDKWLNDYPHKGTETTERLSKIKEMAAVAKGFDGQVEKYVQNGAGGMEAAKGGLINFLGKKEVGAAFGENPYAKVEGGLGTIMRGLSRFQNVVSIVGNVCGKIGMVLTIVGLLGMILPPLGAAVSAVARILNIVGIICDAIGFVLSGILTGLNGVVLAKQIGKGASNEEKAATADMMVTEATSAGGHVLSLAMSYGPGFMKGFKKASGGVVSKLLARFKATVGKFAAKSLGPVAGWAKNVGYKMGFGLNGSKGLLSKIWKSPATVMESIRGTKLITKINNSKVMQGLEQNAAKLNSVGWANKIDGLGEDLGTKVSGAGENSVRGKRYAVQASEAEKQLDQAVGENAAKDAGNRESAKIDRDITKNREVGNNEITDHRDDDGHIPQENVRRSDAAYNRADELEAGKDHSVEETSKEAGVEGTAKSREKREEKIEEPKEEAKKIKEFNEDPKKWQEETDVIEAEREVVAQRLKDKNLTEDERKVAKDEAKKLRHEADERHLIAMKAGGGEAPENLWAAKNYGKEWWGALHFKDEKGEKAEENTKQVEKASGHAATEKLEKAEQHENIQEWAKGEEPQLEVYEHVEGLLEGVDEAADDHDEGAGHEDEGGGGGEPDDNASAEPSSEPRTPEPASNEGDHGSAGGVAVSEPAPVPVRAAAPAAEPAGEADPAAGLPPLAYWPKLSGSNGEFAQAAKDLQHMKLVAYAFHKSQLEAKKKALDTVATLAKSSEDATLKQARAMDHSLTINGTIEEASKAGASADHGTQQAGDGQKQQASGQQNSNSGNQPQVDPGEKPSRWHPIKRIWWYVKKWASDKAAKVFGWIQDKIASLVLRGLCGVSMDDMRGYTTALHNRMQFSKLVGTEGQANATKAMDKSLSVKAESKTYAEEALDDAKACDQNITDADTFVKDVEATEKDLAGEQARAKQFLAELAAAVAAERAKQAAEKQKKEADAIKGAQPGAPVARPQVAIAAVPAQIARKPKSKSKPAEPKVSAAAVGKVQNAASYVASQASVLVEQLMSSKNTQAAQLRTKLENKRSAQPILAKLKTGESIVMDAQADARKVAAKMNTIRGEAPATAQALRGAAGEVKSEAKELDELSETAHEQLNWQFKLAYDKIARTSNMPKFG
jgi:hypothetical protein